MTGSQKRDVVVGAGSGIGCALIHRWIDLAARPVVAIARSPNNHTGSIIKEIKEYTSY